jgi:uracil-DNA glycosylase
LNLEARWGHMYSDDQIRKIGAVMPRRMANEDYRQQQWEHRYDAHIEPINKLVDELRENKKEWMPYVAPIYGGTKAKLLYVLRDPGPKTHADNEGSGFLSLENDDPTAEKVCNLFFEANIRPKDTLPWNAYPWYINRKPTIEELADGVKALKSVIDRLPDLKVIVFLGGVAKSAWKKFNRQYPTIITERGIHVVQTYHTSPQAFWSPDPDVRENRRQHLRDSFSEAARIL